MGMIEIVLTVCALSQPATCQESRLQFAREGPLSQCAMNAQPEIAKWIGDHPNWIVARWRCEDPERRAKGA